MGCSSLGALHHVVVRTLSVLVDTLQISLLVALHCVFGVPVGFYCSKMHFSFLVDFDYWEQTKILINVSGLGGLGVGIKISTVYLFLLCCLLFLPLANCCSEVPLTVTDVNEAVLAQL